MPYLPYIIAGLWLTGFILLVWGYRVAPEQPPHENHIAQGPDGTTDNGTKS